MDRQRLLCFSSAVLLPLVALVVRLALTPWLSAHDAYGLFLIPVAVASWCGGLGSGLLALFLSLLLCGAFFAGQSLPDFFLLSILLTTGLTIALFSELFHRARRHLETRTGQLEEAAAEKDRMLALLVHELRNPLSSMSNALQLMKLRTAAGHDLARPQEIAERALHQMSRLIDDLMDVSRIARGRVQLRYMSFDLREVLTMLAPAMEEAAAAKGIQFHLQMPYPVQVFADAVRLTQVFGNLIGNAIKFTDQGEVEVNVLREDHTALVEIMDSGIGIPENVQPFIWDPFRQGRITESRGGLGLGLSVVKGLVEIHGGNVELTWSQPGHGSCFTVELPLEEGIKKAGTGTNDTGDTKNFLDLEKSG